MNSVATQKERTPTGGNNTPEEATVTETERQHSQIPDITPEETIVTETERFCALVQVILLLREQPSGRGKVIDNSRSVIDGSWSILIRRRSVIITRDWRIVIKGWNITARSWVSLSEVTPAISSGDAHSITAGACGRVVVPGR